MSEQTLGQYNRVHAGKAWEVIAVLTDSGAVWCGSCASDLLVESEEYSPIFGSSEVMRDTVCDKCYYPING